MRREMESEKWSSEFFHKKLKHLMTKILQCTTSIKLSPYMVYRYSIWYIGIPGI